MSRSDGVVKTPDHLGNSSYITNLNGAITQHLEYFPFGEVFIEQNASSYATPYKYNGKELDEETGLYYYGARYYNPELSLWLSVDPLAEAFAGWSPYNYTFNNPIIYKERDGRHPVRLAFTAFKIAKKVRRAVKKGKKVNVKDMLTDELMSIIEDGSTILDPNSSPIDKVLALIDLVTGLDVSDLSRNKMKKHRRFLKKAENVAGDSYKYVKDKNVLPVVEATAKKVNDISEKYKKLGKKFKLNANSANSRRALDNLDDTVESFVSKFRKASVMSELPGEFKNKTIRQALLSKNSKVKKLLIDNRWNK